MFPIRDPRGGDHCVWGLLLLLFTAYGEQRRPVCPTVGKHASYSVQTESVCTGHVADIRVFMQRPKKMRWGEDGQDHFSAAAGVSHLIKAQIGIP